MTSKLKALADRVKTWTSSVTSAWPNECEAPGMTAFVGSRHEEDGFEADVMLIDAAQYGHPGASLELAEFYAAANPGAILTLIEQRDKLLLTLKSAIGGVGHLAKTAGVNETAWGVWEAEARTLISGIEGGAA